jgi:UDP-2,3-diacylglucosamine pyrophosphatase LpxH
MQKVEALFISDVHIGSKGCRADALLSVLKKYEPETLFIVGDFIDGWLLKRRYYWKKSFTNVIRKILTYAKNGTKVVYITGNHDDFLRNYGMLELGDIVIADEIIIDGMWIVHGDDYDNIIKYNKWVAMLGSIGYETVIYLSDIIKRIRNYFGRPPKSLSKWVKQKFKGAANFIKIFENTLCEQAKKRNCHTVICGHIHTPNDKMINGIRYMNTGDFIENMSYIVMKKNKLTLHYE